MGRARVVLCWLWLCAAAGAGAGPEWRAQPFPAPERFAVESTLVLAGAAARAPGLAYRLLGSLDVARAHAAPGPGEDPADLLLRFTLEDTRLQTRGGRAHAEWEERGAPWSGRAEFYARWTRGRLAGAWLDPAAPRDQRDYQRALLALFQWSVADGERNETDVSGACRALYESPARDTFRKVKTACAADARAGAARRVARYSLAAGGARLAALHAEEVVTLAGAAPLKARSWHALGALPARGPAAAPAPSLRAALAALPPALREHALALDLAEDAAPAEDLEAALEDERAALEGEEAGAGGGAAAAAALLRLLPALSAASESALAAALRRPERRALLPGLCRALGLAGTEASARAAADFLQLGARDPLEPLAHRYLAGLALALRPHAAAALLALRLGEEARAPALAESALLAAGAAGARAGGEAREAVRAALARGLARCRDAECRRVRLLALANLRADPGEAAPALAEAGARGEALAALAALRGAPTLSAARLERVGRVATNASRAVEVRAAALELAVRRRAGAAGGAAHVARLAAALHAERSRAAHELRRVLWGRLEALADRAGVRALRAALGAREGGWEARAAAGTSSVLRRGAGWLRAGAGAGAEAGAAALDSVQVAAGGLLRRGTVALLNLRPGEGEGEGERDEVEEEELEVEVWTRGLQALAGVEGEGEGEGEAEEASAGLGVSVGGAHLRGAVLFSGQGELLAHVWAGAGAAPAPVLRALRVLRDARLALPLQAGVVLRARVAEAAALALDAHAAVSLWHRTARGALALRAARAASARASVRTRWAELRAEAAAAAEPALHIAFDLDFYDGVALCVRAAVPPHAAESSLELRSVAGGRRHAARRGSAARLQAAGRTLALGRMNDAACRALPPAEDEDY